MKKNYIAIIRDHSQSMSTVARYATRDYNTNILALKEASQRESQDTIVSTIMCGVAGEWGRGGKVVREVVYSNVSALREIREGNYETSGGSTPLFDSVGNAIELLSRAPDAADKDVSFLVMAITDGQDNDSPVWRNKISAKLRELQGTDRWSFVFRVPQGYASALADMGIPRGNILEWEQTEEGFREATVRTSAGISSYYAARGRGETSTKTFFVDLDSVKARDLRADCKDISGEVDIWKVGKDDELIREFCERRSRKAFLKGAAFYELVKTEPKVQDYKQIAIRDRKSGKIYGGQSARQMLGLPLRGTVRLVPKNLSAYDVFVQSTSVNRKLTPHTSVLYWPAIGVPYVEGVSAPYDRR